jgi:flagellar protein FlaG
LLIWLLCKVFIAERLKFAAFVSIWANTTYLAIHGKAERKVYMLSEIQGASRPQIAPPLRAAVAAPVSVPASATSSPLEAAAAPEQNKPKVQAPKPIEVKVDVEKMRANLQESLDKMNAALRDGGRNLNFLMDEKAGGLVVLVKNADTGEVVRQIPNETVVRMAHSIEAFKGILHNELS